MIKVKETIPLAILIKKEKRYLIDSESHLIFFDKNVISYDRLPNIFGEFNSHWTEESIRPFILHCIDLFGVDRCMFGSNWPVDSIYSSYTELIEAYKEVIDAFSTEDKISLLSANVEKYYRV